MTIPPPTSDGYLDGPHGCTWWRITGDLDDPRRNGRPPLVVAHGGPGMTHDYTLTIARLAHDGRAVIHYDQIGSGRSTHLPDAGPRFWTVELFCEELRRLLVHLGVADSYHLLGQSWGGMLAAEHAITRPTGLVGLVLANSPASMALWATGIARLRRGLPAELEARLSEHENAGTTDSAEYKAAEQEFYDRHMCRVLPNPPELVATFAALEADPTVYRTMVGPSDFHITGTLRDWSVVDRIDRITAPTLVINGRYDEATNICVQPFVDRIPDVRHRVFADSSHLPHIEEEELYLRTVDDFLDECEHGAVGTPRGTTDDNPLARQIEE